MTDAHGGGFGRHLWLPYTQMKTAPAPLVAESTAGVRIRLRDGRELIDGIASWWTACHGYNHPHITAAVTEQAARMPHIMFGGFIHEPAARLAERLAALLPGDLDHVFFSDSGSVAVEVAMKMALQYWLNRGDAGRTRFVCFRHGYHGDTAGAMSVCDPEEGMHRLFRDHVARQIVTDLPRGPEAHAQFDAFLASHAGEVAAVIMEPLIQGAGGMKFHDPADLAAIAASARRHGVLLILDEIFTGFARTGTMFACAAAEVTPDIICLGKALTGGALTLAATVARRHVFEAFLSDDAGRALMHGPTFMGNPLACAAANASLDLFEREPRLAQVKMIEARMIAGLAPCRGIPGVVDVRVRGAVGVVELAGRPDLVALRQGAVKRGLWLRPFGNIIYLAPALTIGADDLDALTSGICAILGQEDWRESPAGKVQEWE